MASYMDAFGHKSLNYFDHISRLINNEQSGSRYDPPMNAHLINRRF